MEEAMEPPKDEEMHHEEEPVAVSPPEEEETKIVRESESEPQVEPVNGHQDQEDQADQADQAEDDDNNNEEFTPPPDSLAEETMSQATSSPPLNDEIVVGTNANRAKSSPLPPISDDPEDLEMLDEVDEDQSMQPPYSKRKRTSGYNDSVENSVGSNSPVVPSEAAVRPSRVGRPPKGAMNSGAHGMGGVKGVTLGYWRESPVPDALDKHAVIGFIDVRDRLRTRIQPTTRDGRNIAQEYPLPPGPGGSWVTFDKVAFDQHLVNLDHYQVKEFVKVRVETSLAEETTEQKAELDEAAVKEAIRRIQSNPPPESTAPVAIAYGPVIPEHAHLPHRPDKRRKMNNADGTPTQTLLPTPGLAPIDNLPGTRPTRILLGCWKLSSEASRDNKHAVYGILGANDMFRVKLVRETRDGRPQNGNFPAGPGALWIHWDQVDFEDHLRELSRAEIKEYCRVRQRQLDDGEMPDEREENQKLAVTEAKQRVASGFVSRKEDPILMSHFPPQATNGIDYDDMRDFAMQDRRDTVQEPRQSRRVELAQRSRHSLPTDARLQTVDALERTNSIARREIARVEAAQMRADQRAAASRETSAAPISNKLLFQDNVSRLNKVWVAQEANRLKAGAEDAKMYMGVKYERKQSGPFQGKLVSQGTIISIDGEDYVEYRVLTKPSFF